MLEEFAGVLKQVRDHKPLVHNITNVVVTNFTANGLLALGASPVMAYSIKEVEDMAKMAGALVLNIGTLNEAEVAAMILAGKSANAHGVPVIFDPVGAGATPYRTETARQIVKEVNVDLIRGNAAEIANVIGETWEIKGVDSGKISGDVKGLAILAAQKLHTNIAVTGRVDIITDGQTVYMGENGHPMLTQVTGTGCLLTSVIGAFAAVEKDTLKAGISAITFYGVTAELAFSQSGKAGPGSFQVEFLNQLANVTVDDVLKYGRVKQESN